MKHSLTNRMQACAAWLVNAGQHSVAGLEIVDFGGPARVAEQAMDRRPRVERELVCRADEARHMRSGALVVQHMPQQTRVKESCNER